MAGRDRQAGTRAPWGAAAQPGLAGGHGPHPVSVKAAGGVASARLTFPAGLCARGEVPLCPERGVSVC